MSDDEGNGTGVGRDDGGDDAAMARILDFPGVDDTVIDVADLSYDLSNPDEAAEAIRRMRSAHHRLKEHAAAMRIALCRMAVITVEMEDEARDLQDEAASIGSRLALRRSELETKAATMLEIAASYRRALEDVADY